MKHDDNESGHMVMVTFGLALALAACASEAPVVEDTPGIRALSGTYAFVVEASDVAPSLRERCRASAGGDAAKAEACWNEIARDSQNEKIRFSTASGQLVWTSFASAGDKGEREEIFVEVPIAPREPEPRLILAKASGWPHGTLVGQLTHLGFEMRIERPTDDVVVITDPKKGRLVYRRSS